MFFTPGTHKDHGLPHNPFKAIVAPRPIGWISTISKDGKINLGPYSFFNAISETPPIVGFSASPGPNGEKDSLINARDTGCFVVNIVSKAQIDGMNSSSAALPHGQSEFDYAGLEPIASNGIAAPRVKDAPCQLECEIWKILELPPAPNGASNHWVMGLVTGIHIDDRYIVDGKLDVALYNPVSRLGYKDYAMVENLFELERPKS